MREVDLLVQAGFLYPMTGDAPILRDAEVAIAGDRIVHAGARMPEGTWQARRQIGGPDSAVLPGFVNAHTHTVSLVFRGRTDDVAGGAALYDVAFRMEKTIGREEWRDLCCAGAIEMIRSGFTTVNDLWYAPGLMAEACAASGLRAQIANKVFDVALDRLDHRHGRVGAERRLAAELGLLCFEAGAVAARYTGKSKGRSETCPYKTV